MHQYLVSCVLTAVLVGCGLTAAPAASAAPASGAEPEPVPVMTIEAHDELIQASKGKVLFLNFFATWCPPCLEEIPTLVAVREEYGEDQVVLIGLSIDEDPALVRSFAERMRINYPVYMAADELAYMYSVASIPQNAVYDKDGKLVGNQPGLIPEKILQQILREMVAP